MANPTSTTTSSTKKVENTAHQTIDSGKNLVDKAADKTKDLTHNVADRAKDAASSVADKARDAASSISEGASHLAGSAVDRADDAANAAGSGMKNLADSLRRHTSDEGVLGSASNKLADTLESGGKYLQDQGLSGLTDDLGGMIRRYPIGAMLVGVGIGYLLACATSRD